MLTVKNIYDYNIRFLRKRFHDKGEFSSIYDKNMKMAEQLDRSNELINVAYIMINLNCRKRDRSYYLDEKFVLDDIKVLVYVLRHMIDEYNWW